MGRISTFIFTISQIALQPLLWLSVLGIKYKSQGVALINRSLPLPENADFDTWTREKKKYLKAKVTQYCPQLRARMPLIIKVIPNLLLAAVFFPAAGYGAMLYAWHVGEVSILVLGVTQVFFQSVLTFSLVARQLSKAGLENIEAILTAEDPEDDDSVPPAAPAPASAPAPDPAPAAEDDGNVGAIRGLFED